MVKSLFVSLVAALIVTGSPVARAESPPISGSVQNFIVHEEPLAAPDTVFFSQNDGDKTLADLQGRVTLVNFWATWCGPCVRELPSIQHLQDSMGGDDFTVALVSQDRDGWKRIVPFLKRLKITGPASYLDKKLKLSRALGVSSLPVSLLLDADGNEVGRVVGAAEWDTPEAAALIQHYVDAGRAN